MKALLELIKKLYGSKALSKTIGTRTNVITLPDKETKRFISNELNIDAASDAAVKKAYEDVEKLIPDIPKMNDQEILTLTGNLRRLDNRLNPPSAEVISIGTKQPVSKEGIKSLTEQAGQKSPPGTLMGNLESRLNQLRASGKELEDIVKDMAPKDPYAEIRRIIENPTPEEAAIKAKEKARLSKVFEQLTQNPYRSGGPLDPKVGIVRTAAREILEKNLKAGKIDIPDPAAKDAILKSYQGGTDPIDVLRQTYGEGILEQLDDVADELNKARDYKDIQKILEREKLFDVKPKKTYGYDEGGMSDEEMIKFLKKAEDETPDEFATGGRVGFSGGKLVGKGIAKLASKLKENAEKEMNKAYRNIEHRMVGEDYKYEAQELADELAEVRFKNEFSDLDQKTQMDLYDESYNFLMEGRREKAQRYKNIKIFDDKEASALTQFIKETDPEGYKRIEKIVDDINNKNTLENFDPTGRKKNAIGGRVGFADGGVSKGLDYLMGIERPKYELGGSVYDRYQELLNEISNPESATSAQAVPYYPTTATGGGYEPDTFTPIKTSLQQKLTPITPVDKLITKYLEFPGLLSAAFAVGKEYLGLSDAQKDLYGGLGFGYSGLSGLMKDQFGYNAMASNFLAPDSTSRRTYKEKLGYTDEELDKIRNDLANVPTKRDIRLQQTGAKQLNQIDWDAVDRDQAGDSGGVSSPFGGYNGFDGTEGTFSTDTSDTGATQSNQNSVDTAAQDADQSGGEASSTSGADPAGDGGDGYAIGGRVGFQKGTPAIFNQLEMDVPYPYGHRVEMASGGITALKALLKFFAEQRGKKGSDMLKEINPKRLGFLQNMLRKSDKDMLDANRQEYLEDLSEIIKSDKKLLDRIKEMPADQQATFFKSANEGGNRGRLDVYRDPNFNIEDAIGEIEQMKKNLKFKDVPEKEVKRQMNASGGVAYLMGL